jgi:hypothetical protein
LAGIVLGAASAGAAPEAPQPKLASPAELTRCVDAWGPEPCLQALHVYVKARPDQAFEAGRVVTKIYAHWAAIPFFDEALAAKAEPARCKDERLALAVTSALGQPNDFESAAIVESATTILRDRCWKELHGPISKELGKDDRGTLTRNACRVFAEKNQPSPACWPEPLAPGARAQDSTWETLDPKEIQLEGGASVYGGSDGRRITIAKVKGKSYYLIKFQGFRGPWNGKVVIHRQEAAGSGYDYWTPVEGRRYVSLVVRKTQGAASGLWEVHPLGVKGSFRLALDPAATKAAKAQSLLAELTR